ncbi:MAG: GntR family transcriptional regulator [Planctomycetaceae bacterium]|nr:GntR family transcriptional regulator [Planctomycetaceae bacterium]
MDISEDELQKELGISRTPIREAMQHLQQEGFVYIYPRKGTIVAEVTEDLIKEIFHMRSLNEAYIVKQASNFVPLQWLEEMRSNFLASTEKTRRELMILDRDLHFGFLKYCNNRFMQNIMAVVYDHNHRIRLIVSDPRPREGDNSIEEHVGIIEAAMRRDTQAIDNLVTMHVERSCNISVGYFRR